MTVLGFHTTPREAVVWIDSESLNRDGTHGHFRSKMKVNPLAGAVLVSTGWSAMSAAADKAFLSAIDIDDAVRFLPKKLRDTALHLVANGADPERINRQEMFLIGYIRAAGRVAAYRLAGDAMFHPTLQVSDCSPWVDDFDPTRQPMPDDVVRIAQAQVAALRGAYPEASGGILVVAAIRDGEVSSRALHDLSRDQVPDLAITLQAAE